VDLIRPVERGRCQAVGDGEARGFQLLALEEVEQDRQPQRVELESVQVGQHWHQTPQEALVRGLIVPN